MAVGAVLAGAIGAESTSKLAGRDNAAMVAPRSRPEQSAGAAAAVTEPSRDALVDTILARPLFAAKRRPAVKATVRGAPQIASIPRLSGIIMSADQRRAIFADPGEGRRSIVAALGGHVGAYVVQAIEQEKVTLVGPGGTQVLQPSFDSTPRRVEPVAAAAAAQQAPFANALAVMPSLRNLAGFGGAPVLDEGGPDRLSRLSSLRRALAPQQNAVK